MKKICLTIGLIFGILTIYAQETETIDNKPKEEFKTIFGGKKIGGYGSLGLGYTRIDGEHALALYARGGVVLGHSLAMGVGGSGFINNYQFIPELNEKASLAGGYGGFFVEPILFPRMPVHLSFPVLAGVGGLSYTTSITDNFIGSQNNEVQSTGFFLVLEPSVELEFNFTKFFRMNVFGSYRLTSDLEDMPYTSPDALNFYTLGMKFKFGKF